MEKDFWQYFILILTGINSTLLAFSKEICERYPKAKFLDKLLFKILAVVAISFLTFFSTNRIESLNETERIAVSRASMKEEIKRDSQFQESLKERDYTHERREDSLANSYRQQVDSSYQRSLKASNSALASYNLILVDSLNRVTEKINIKNEGIPLLRVSPAGVGRPSAYLLGDTVICVRVISSVATSYNIELAGYLLSVNGDRVDGHYLTKTLSIGTNPLEPGGTIFRTYRVQFDKKLLQVKGLALFIFGTYKKSPSDSVYIPFKEGVTITTETNKVDLTVWGNDDFKEHISFLRTFGLLVFDPDRK